MDFLFHVRGQKQIRDPRVLPPSVCLQVGCKVLHFFHMYMLGCNYFWMLCEGIYLHTLIVVAVFAEEQHLHWYYLLGWGESVSMKSDQLFLHPVVNLQTLICICSLDRKLTERLFSKPQI